MNHLMWIVMAERPGYRLWTREVIAYFGRVWKGSKGEVYTISNFTYNRYYHTSTRLYRMKLMTANLCWKCKTGKNFPILPMRQHSGILSSCSGSVIPLTALRLLHRSQIPNISNGTFLVRKAGLITASILRHWKTWI